MWVFGKDVKGIETYIKITVGKPNMKTICISFHRAEHPMAYPLKENKYYYVAGSEEYGKPADRWDSHFKLGMERNRIPQRKVYSDDPLLCL